MMNPMYTSAIDSNAKDINYVDYTPRRVGMRTPAYLKGQSSAGGTPFNYHYDDHNDTIYDDYTTSEKNMISNQLTFAREKRTLLYQQLAATEDQSYLEEGMNVMDSPAVRRHFGVNERVVDVEAWNNALTSGKKSMERREDWSIHDFIVGENLGTGKFGTVYKAREKRSGQIVALKIMKKKELEEASVIQFLKREIEIQYHLDHPNIAKLFGYFHNRDTVVLVMEYGGDSDLYTCLSTHKRFTEAEAANFIVEIADALVYMHGLGVIHRDLKLENVLISKDGNLKIADFGWAVYDPNPRRRTFCGTLDYLPPEMIQRKAYGQAVDVWALGVICYELLVGIAPFEDVANLREDFVNPERVYQRIVEAQIQFPDDLSSGAKEFMLKLLQRDPSARIPMSAIEYDPWIQSFLV